MPMTNSATRNIIEDLKCILQLYPIPKGSKQPNYFLRQCRQITADLFTNTLFNSISFVKYCNMTFVG